MRNIIWMIIINAVILACGIFLALVIRGSVTIKGTDQQVMAVFCGIILICVMASGLEAFLR